MSHVCRTPSAHFSLLPTQLCALLPPASSSSRSAFPHTTSLLVHVRIPAGKRLLTGQEEQQMNTDPKHCVPTDEDELHIVAYCWGRNLNTTASILQEGEEQQQPPTRSGPKQEPTRLTSQHLCKVGVPREGAQQTATCCASPWPQPLTALSLQCIPSLL